MKEQWIENKRFNKWQIYHSPAGYANTNSNIESFNRQIKGFTQKKKLSIFGMLEVLRNGPILFQGILQNGPSKRSDMSITFLNFPRREKNFAHGPDL